MVRVQFVTFNIIKPQRVATTTTPKKSLRKFARLHHPRPLWNFNSKVVPCFHCQAAANPKLLS